MAENVPQWLEDHLSQVDPMCGGDPERTEHECDECGNFMARWTKLKFPGGFVKSKTFSDQSETPYDFSSICGLWCTPDFFSEECGYWDKLGQHRDGHDDQFELPIAAIEYSIAYSSYILYRLSGKQWQGMCERVLHPGCCPELGIHFHYLDTEYQRDTDYARNGRLIGENSPGCACENDCGYDVLNLPGPINQIAEVVVDGQVLDKSSYKIRGHRELIRTDGEHWPNANDLSRSPYKSIGIINASVPFETRPKPTWVDQYVSETSSVTETHIPLPDEYDSAPDWAVEFLARLPEDCEVPDKPWLTKYFGRCGITRKTVPANSKAPRIVSRAQVAHATNNCCPSRCVASGKPKCQTSIDVRSVWQYEPQCESGTWVDEWKDANCFTDAKPEEFSKRGGRFNSCQPGSQSISDAEIPFWAREAMGLEREPENVSPNPEFPDWVNRHLGAEVPQEVASWISDTLEDERYFVKPELELAKPNVKHEWAVPNKGMADYLDSENQVCYDPDSPAWLVRYWQGKCPPVDAQLACAALAKEIAGYLCTDRCFPSNTRRMEAGNSLDIRIADRFSILAKGKTGIFEVDLWLQSVNPMGIMRRGQVIRPDMKRRRHFSLRD